jgi:hypothetical protein
LLIANRGDGAVGRWRAVTSRRRTSRGATRRTTGVSVIGVGNRPSTAADEETDRERANTRCVAQMSGDDDLLLQQNDMLIPQDIVAQTCLYPLEIRAPEAGPKSADHPWRRGSVRSQRGHCLSPSSKPSGPPSPAQPRHQRFLVTPRGRRRSGPRLSPRSKACGIRYNVRVILVRACAIWEAGGFSRGRANVRMQPNNQDRSNLHWRR